MEFHFPAVAFLFAFLLFLFKAQKLVKGGNNPSRKKMPLGPWKLPIIGNMHQLVGSLPHRRLRDLATKYGPLMHLQLGEVSTVVISSPEIAEEVLKTHGTVFAQRPSLVSCKMLTYNYKGIIFTSYGSYWRYVRKICAKQLLSTTQVQSLGSIREDEASDMIKSIYSNRGSLVNLSDRIYELTYSITARATFGNKCKDQEAYISVIKEVVKIIGGFCIADFYPSIEILLYGISGLKAKVDELFRRMDTILQDILNEHKRRKTTEQEAKEDLVDALLKFQHDSDLKFPLTDSNIKAVIADIFAAGSETSSTTVEWAMSEMLKNPRVMKKAQAEVRHVFYAKRNVDETGIHELRYLKSVIKETLRLHPAGPLSVPRESTEDCEINGYEIPAKTRVLVNVWAIGRDPRYWKDAETFYPERFLDDDSWVDFKGTNFHYIPFGGGKRICPGISFALPNVELPLAKLLYHFDWELESKMRLEDLDMTEQSGLTVRRKQDLLLIPIPYSHASFE